MNFPADLRQSWPMPATPCPVILIGAGGIARDAHLPAYRKAGFTVRGVYDLDAGRATALAAQWGIAHQYGSLAQACAQTDCVFDVAAPPDAHEAVLRAVPEGAAVLLQKPFGLDLAQAGRLLSVCRERRLVAAVNFQLRFAPMMLAMRDAIDRGLLGELVEIEAHLNLTTPWHLFPHLAANPRVEIVSHSIHYLDLIRAVAGEPRSVFARSFGHPRSALADTRTSAILDYGPVLRCALSINHHHDFGRRFQEATLRFEGVDGAALVKLGVLLDYPRGEPDALWLGARGGQWSEVPLAGAWFPAAFAGTMANLQRFACGEDDTLVSSVEDAWRTMALVETCYRAAHAPGTPVDAPPRSDDFRAAATTGEAT
jgi:predicted dehydrogenase